MTNKIRMDMSCFEAMVALSEGNPGAVSVLTQLARAGSKHDPDDATGGIGPMLDLDDLGIYGSRIWQLYKDVCGQKLGVMLAVLRAHQLGFIKTEELLERIGADEKRGTPFEDLSDILAEVQGALPSFKLEVAS